MSGEQHKDGGPWPERFVPGQAAPMTAEQAMAELWGTFCPDCGPQDYAGILAEAKRHAPPPRADAPRAEGG